MVPPSQLPCPLLSSSTRTPAGARSVTATSVAVDGPALWTVIVQVAGAPGTIGSGVTVLVTDRSAWLVSSAVAVEVLLVASGSSAPSPC